jgi:hypothetical protein
MLKSGMKGMGSLEGRPLGKRAAPGKQSLASAHDGGAGSRGKSSGVGGQKSVVKAYHGRTSKA